MERDGNPESVWFMGLFGVLFLCCDYYHFVGSRISENLIGLIGVNYGD